MRRYGMDLGVVGTGILGVNPRRVKASTGGAQVSRKQRRDPRYRVGDARRAMAGGPARLPRYRDSEEFRREFRYPFRPGH